MKTSVIWIFTLIVLSFFIFFLKSIWKSKKEFSQGKTILNQEVLWQKNLLIYHFVFLGPGNKITFQKNKILHHFLHNFTATMRRKFNYLVYLDLFAGSGLINLGKKGFTYGAPVIALSEQNGFSKHIFLK